MKPKILITQNIANKGVLPTDHFSVVFLEKEFNQENLADFYLKNKNIYAIISFVTDKVTAEIISLLPDSLKVISNCAVGYNNIDIEACKRKNIIVTNTPGVLTNATADLTFALLLSLSRRIIEGHKMILNNQFTGWKPDMLLGAELSGKTLGIIGMGRIGKAVAKRAEAFNMNIIFNNRNYSANEQNCDYSFKPLNELFAQSDFISIHVSLNEKSYHLITKKELSLMKKTAYIINTSRGECIKEADLVNALKNAEIAGVALDVFEFEPKVTEELKYFPNVVLTPHIGSATTETRAKMFEIACQNIINIYEGTEPVSRVV